MTAIAHALSRAFQSTGEFDALNNFGTLKKITPFCGVGLVVSLVCLTYGLTSARASSEAVSGETDVLGNLSGKDKVLDLVGAIYDAALDVQNWPDVLNGIGMAAR